MAAGTSRTASRVRRRAELGPRLLEAVERLLADGTSYTALTVEELLVAADVPRSTFYKTFDGKGDLLLAWLEQIIDEIEDSADAWWSLDGDAGPDDLRAALLDAIASYEPHAVLMSAAYEVAPFDPDVRGAMADLVARGTGGLRRHIKRGQKAGWVDPDVPADDAATWIVSMQERGFQQLRRLAGEDELQPLLDAQADLIWHALYAHAPARTPHPG
jgi:AcrR family transcriptional regulator